MREKLGESLLQLHNLVCGAMIVILPASLYGDDAGAAMLHNQGGVLLNGNPAPASSALFPNDTVQTQMHSEAAIDTTGSTATLQEDTLIQFQDNELVLQQGTVLVSTSRRMTVRVGCITVIPTNDGWTQYFVSDTDGRVTVNAHKNDVNIEVRRAGSPQARQPRLSDKATVHEGEQATREERCAALERSPAQIAAKGAILNSLWVKGPALAAIGVVTCWEVCRGDDPVSPSRP